MGARIVGRKSSLHKRGGQTNIPSPMRWLVLSFLAVLVGCGNLIAVPDFGISAPGCRGPSKCFVSSSDGCDCTTAGLQRIHGIPTMPGGCIGIDPGATL